MVTDGTKVKLAIDSFAKDDKGLLIGVTSSESEAIVDKLAPAKAGGGARCRVIDERDHPAGPPI